MCLAILVEENLSEKLTRVTDQKIRIDIYVEA